MAQNIIVTGGAGYIGSHTILELIRHTDFEVVSIDNYLNSEKSTYERIKKITGKEVKYLEIDICDLKALKRGIEKIENPVGVIHFAALKSVPESVEKPLWYFENNMNALFNMLECCDEFNIPSFIFSSSCSVYGNVKQLPVNEMSPLSEAESPYASTKKMGEEVIRFTVANKPVKAILLRYFNPVGADKTGELGELPSNRPNNLVPVITQTAVGKIPKMTVFGGDYGTRDGSCIRDYIHVTDIADAHIKALQYLLDGKQEANCDVYNLGSGNGVSVFEAIEAFENESGVKLNYEVGPRRGGDVEAIYSDSTKAKELLGWVPKYDIKEMMASAWKWQQNLEK